MYCIPPAERVGECSELSHDSGRHNRAVCWDGIPNGHSTANPRWEDPVSLRNSFYFVLGIQRFLPFASGSNEVPPFLFGRDGRSCSRGIGSYGWMIQPRRAPFPPARQGGHPYPCLPVLIFRFSIRIIVLGRAAGASGNRCGDVWPRFRRHWRLSEVVSSRPKRGITLRLGTALRNRNRRVWHALTPRPHGAGSAGAPIEHARCLRHCSSHQ